MSKVFDVFLYFICRIQWFMCTYLCSHWLDILVLMLFWTWWKCMVRLLLSLVCSASYQYFLGRLRRVDLIISIWGSECPVRLSTKSFSDSDEIWYVGRGRWVMHDVCRMTRSKVKVTRPLKLEIHRFSKCISSAIFMWAGKWPLILKLRNNI